MRCWTTWRCIALCCACLQMTLCAEAYTSPNITFNNVLEYSTVVRARSTPVLALVHARICPHLRHLQAPEFNVEELFKLHCAHMKFGVQATPSDHFPLVMGTSLIRYGQKGMQW